MGVRRAGRELALQVLYLQDVSALSWEKAFAFVFKEPQSEAIVAFTRHLVEGVFEYKQKIDELISSTAENWDLQRMAVVDRNILRIATFELLRDLETPVSVILNEAIELSKIYSTADSAKFVNGILDKIAHERVFLQNKS